VIRVLLAEDVIMLRKALAALLDMAPDITVVAEEGAGDRVLERSLEVRPDVAVLDIDLPGADGIKVAGQIHERLSECRTIILTSLGRPGNLRRALAARVSGFLLKDADPDGLVAAIRSVAAGERVIDPQLAVATLEAADEPVLTPRELKVLGLAAEGDDVTEIADRLHLSVGTVRNYLTVINGKLNARNRLDAVRIARESGWL
jgi:two-component system, NarL family, response regulator DesR